MTYRGLLSQILALTCGLVVGGCASHNKPTDSKVYTQNMKPVLVDKIPAFTAKRCPSKLDSVWSKKWQDKIDYANACVMEKKWVSVDKIGKHLSQTEFYSPWGAYYQSLVAEAWKNYPRAHWMIDLALKKAPKVGLFYYQRARILWREGENRPAFEAAEKAVKLDEDIVGAHQLLGQVLFYEQDFGKAAEHFESVLRRDPKNSEVLTNLAECKIKLQDPDGALRILSKSSSYYPKNLHYMVRQAEVLEKIKGDFAGALVLYERIHRLRQAGRLRGKAGYSIVRKIGELKTTVKLIKQEQEGNKVATSEDIKKSRKPAAKRRKK